MLPFPEVPKTGGEWETWQAVLEEHRAPILWKLEGLDRERAGRSTVPSGTSLLGIVKHLAWVERWWFCDFIGGQSAETRGVTRAPPPIGGWSRKIPSSR